MELADRIKKIRETFGLNQGDLAELLGTSIGTPKGWEQGKTKSIKPKHSVLISQKLNISKEWIETGKGEMRIDRNGELLKDISFLANTLNKNVLNIPFYEDINASAGAGCINTESDPSYIQLLPNMLPTRSKKIDAIKVAGDSMTGTVEDGDIIFIDKNHQEVIDGKIYVISLCGDIYVKRIFRNPSKQTLILKSDNPVYPQFDVDTEEFQIIGRVVAKMNIKEL